MSHNNLIHPNAAFLGQHAFRLLIVFVFEFSVIKMLR